MEEYHTSRQPHLGERSNIYMHDSLRLVPSDYENYDLLVPHQQVYCPAAILLLIFCFSGSTCFPSHRLGYMTTMSYITIGVEGAGVVIPEGQPVITPRPRGHGPTSEWERFRLVVKQLYVDENRTLKEVMSTLEREHGHVGTVKQYKGRIKAWGFDKNNKDNEVSAVLRMKTRRDAVGKDSAFRVRGKPMTVDDVYRYFRRKRILDPDSHAQRPGVSTPPAIECWTPVSSASPKVQASELTKDGEVRETQSPKLRNPGPEEMSAAETVDATHQAGDRLALLSIDQARDFLFSNSRIQSFEVPQSPLPPRCLLVPEKLFASTKAYLDGVFDGKRNTSLRLATKVSSDFANTCVLGIELMYSESFIEGRRSFSRASTLLSSMLLHEAPGCIHPILDFGLRLREAGCWEIAKSLLCLASGLATTFYADGHPLVQIFACIENLDESAFELATLQAWRCICDVFSNSLGQFSPYTLSCNLNFLVREHHMSPNKSLDLIHKLLTQAEMELGSSDERLIYAKSIYAFMLHNQQRFAEAVAILDKISVSSFEIYSSSVILSVLRLSGICHSRLGQFHEAESKLRQVVKRSEVLFGLKDMNTLRSKFDLRLLLRGLGRYSEADLLTWEIDDGLGADDIDVMDVNAMTVTL